MKLVVYVKTVTGKTVFIGEIEGWNEVTSVIFAAELIALINRAVQLYSKANDIILRFQKED